MKGLLVADLCQIAFRKACHFHDGITVDTILQHSSSHFEFTLRLASEMAFLPASAGLSNSVRIRLRLPV